MNLEEIIHTYKYTCKHDGREAADKFLNGIGLSEELIKAVKDTVQRDAARGLFTASSQQFGEAAVRAARGKDAPTTESETMSCCAEPKLRGGRCCSCGEWIEDLCVVTK